MDTAKNERRRYHRRSDEERIRDLEKKIADLKARQARKEKQVDPVLKEIPKIQKRLRKFAQLAMDHQRPDIANSTTAFNAGLERILAQSRPNGRASAAPADEADQDE